MLASNMIKERLYAFKSEEQIQVWMSEAVYWTWDYVIGFAEYFSQKSSISFWAAAV